MTGNKRLRSPASYFVEGEASVSSPARVAKELRDSAAAAEHDDEYDRDFVVEHAEPTPDVSSESEASFTDASSSSSSEEEEEDSSSSSSEGEEKPKKKDKDKDHKPEHWRFPFLHIFDWSTPKDKFQSPQMKIKLLQLKRERLMTRVKSLDDEIEQLRAEINKK